MRACLCVESAGAAMQKTALPKHLAMAMSGFDPGPDCDVSVAGAAELGGSFDPGPDIAEPLELPTKRCRIGLYGLDVDSADCAFHGDPDLDIHLDGSEVSEESEREVSEETEPEASEKSQAKRSHTIGLTANSADMGQGADKPGNLSSYAQRALDPERIAEVLSQVDCCKKRCKSTISFQEVSEVREKYWHLPDTKQRFLLRYLWTLDAADVQSAVQQSLDEVVKTRSTWFFAGKQMCFNAFCSLLGSAKRTVLARIHGHVDTRTTNVLREKPKTKNIDRFWLEYWSSNAETLALPEMTRPTKEDGDDAIVYDEGVLVPMEEYDFSAVEDWTVGTSDVELLSRLGNKVALMKLPRRFLPHGRLLDYYMEYCSWLGDLTTSDATPAAEVSEVFEASEASEGAVATFSTFAARWAELWRHVLKIRKSSQHHECNICFKYRQQLRAHGCLDEKLEIATSWRHHLHWQYMDRCVYWSMRWASRCKRDVLTIVIDGLDKSKFALPKYTCGRKSQELDQCHRPRVNITGAIAHGYCRGVYISDQQINTGGSFFCELLSQTIEKVSKIGALPSHLFVLVDNTIAQAKNVETSQFMTYLAAKCHFRSTNLVMLTEGHTHEDIGTYATTI